MTRAAWAKVNLYLQVTGRRPDGYHELDSLVVFAGIGDRLSLAPAEDLGLTVSGPMAPQLDAQLGAQPGAQCENLVIRAGQGLRRACNVAQGAEIDLFKRLPVAAGLGGGSSDAAAALSGLVALWGLEPAPASLAAVARELGADVPVCLYGRPAFVAGIGKHIVRAPPLPAAWLTLVNPNIALPTHEVFAARRGPFSAPGRWQEPCNDIQALAEELAALGNDLEAPARDLVPEIDEVLALLAAVPGNLLTRLSGSGASCFGLFATAAEAAAAAAEIAATRPQWWVAAAPMLHGPLPRPWEA